MGKSTWEVVKAWQSLDSNCNLQRINDGFYKGSDVMRARFHEDFTFGRHQRGKNVEAQNTSKKTVVRN